MGGDNEHHIQCMAFEILRRFIAHPCDFQAIERAKDDSFALGRLVLAFETLPALNRMQPFTNTQLAQAVGLARVLAGYDEARIPDERRFWCGDWRSSPAESQTQPSCCYHFCLACHGAFSARNMPISAIILGAVVLQDQVSRSRAILDAFRQYS